MLRGVFVAEDTGGIAPPNYRIAEMPYRLSQPGTAAGKFSLSRPNSGWPPGKYRIELYLDDSLARTVPFRIYTAVEAAAYARIVPLLGRAEESEKRGDYRGAASALRDALSISEKELGAEHPDTAALVNNLALALKQTGAYGESAQLYRRALALVEKLEGPERPIYALILINLGEIHNLRGEYAEAESLLQRALRIAEKAAGPEHHITGAALNNLGRTYQLRADYKQAEALYMRALPVLEKSLGPEDAEVGTLANNLAELYREQKDFARAEPLYRRALEIKEKLLPPGNPELALSRNNLALLYIARGEYGRAEPLLRRAVGDTERALGAGHPDAGGMLYNLGLLYHERGDLAQAEPLYQRVLPIFERALGPRHSNVAQVQISAARLSAARGDLREALARLSSAEEVRENNLALVLATGSEQQKQLYLDTLFGETNLTLSFHLQTAQADEGAARLALTTLLRRKGRALDAAADQVGLLRRRLPPNEQALLDQLSATRSQLATLLLQPPSAGDEAERQARVARLEAEAGRLEAEVGARSAEFRAASRPVTIDAVRAALPAGSALIELTRYHPFNFKAPLDRGFAAARYAAYVLRPDGAPGWAELGPAEPIEHAVGELRRALKSPNRSDVRQPARALDELVMRPTRRLLGESKQLFVAPDAALNLVPFEALVDEQNRYLVESYSFTYMTSGRDLLRLQASAKSDQPPVVIADPSFDGESRGGTALNSEGDTARSADLRNVSFGPLPGTAGEAQAVAPLLPGAQLLTQGRATEAALKQIKSPSILHVATHGFFLAEQPQDPGAAARGLALATGNVAALTSSARENPLLRSGLALAGANQRRGGGAEDGVLTALEAAGLDLWGTQLVVLSACETGLGEVTSGAGVYGLRRALVLAGSEAQVMSLWQVDDAATRDLMTAYYRRLRAGEGRGAALRQVQLEMLKGGGQEPSGPQRGLAGELGGPRKAGDRSHPFYWAAFIQSGDWRPIAARQGPSK
jgi:CHAT domain-containing protein